MRADKIYAFRNPADGRIKIGHSTNVAVRLATSRSWVPDIELLAVGEGGAPREQAAHQMLAEHRVARTEWFEPHPDVLAFIDQIPDEVDTTRPSPSPRVAPADNINAQAVRAIISARGCSHGSTCIVCALQNKFDPPPARLLLSMSEAANEVGITVSQMEWALADAGLNDQVVTGIGRGRKLRPATIDELIHRNTEAGAA